MSREDAAIGAASRETVVRSLMDEGKPARVIGSAISYFTGKLEAYLRYKEVPYERVAPTPGLWNRVVPRETGARQMPAVELADGRWLTDTTPILEWMETRHPEPAVIPRDPLQAFASRLVEDYADEWMWRPALHYRWSHRRDARLLSDFIAAEMLASIPLPQAWKAFAVRQRQIRRYVRGDGITETTRAHVEAIYLRTLAQLSTILERRPFLLGERPTLADFGFFASMFRHFALDPTPGAIMRDTAPAVYAWVARVWAARARTTHGPLVSGVPEDWGPILDEIGTAYLPYLAANATAWREGRKRFDLTLPGVRYEALPTSRYRVWCLERLQGHQRALAPADQAAARALLERHGAWEPLWHVTDPGSGHDPEGRAPFGRGVEVFGG